MILERLRISGFISYHEPVDLDFSGFDLACISGANGAGKSSLLDALTWALFGQARRRDDALINSASTAAEVVLDFSYEGNHYRVQRSKTTGKTVQLDFFIQNDQGNWKVLTDRAVRETEAHIQQTLKLDYDTFINASFFLQGKADQFAQQKPSDRKRILSSILGLEQWEVFKERAAVRRKQFETDLAGIDSVLDEIRNELSQEDVRRERLKQLETSLSQMTQTRQVQETSLESLHRLSASLDSQRTLVATMENQLHSVELRIRQRSDELERHRQEQSHYQERIAHAEDIESAYQRWQRAREELERWEGIAANFRQHESQRAAPLMAIETEQSRLNQERHHLSQQQTKAEELGNQLPVLQNQHHNVEKETAQLRQQLDQRPILEEQLTNFQHNLTDALAENKKLKGEMAELKERIDNLVEVEGATCPLCGQPLNPADRQALITTLQTQGKEMGDRFRKNQSLLNQGEQQRQTLETDLNQLRQVEKDLNQAQRTVDQLTDRQLQIQQVLEEWRSGGALRLQEIDKILSTKDFAQDARIELARLDAELKTLGYDAAEHDAVRRAEQEGRSSEEMLRQLESARAALEPLLGIITDLLNHITVDEAEAANLEHVYQDALNRYNQDSANLPDLQKAEKELFALKEQENRLRSQVGGALQEVEVLKSLRTRQVDLEEQSSETKKQISRYKTLEKAFSKDGVPALLIEQALPEIETQANKILDLLTDSMMSIRFITQKDYKDKNRDDKKETLDILISDSSGSREYEMFSGGEAFRVNFAIRLALSRVLTQRAGARLQTLVIDEGFGSQDSHGRQRLVEVINQVRQDFKKILVITHLEDLKDAFPARIEVEKTLNGSTLKVVT